MSAPDSVALMSAELRVLSYNVRGLRDDRAALAEVVRAADPDVVCVQEAPKYLRWRAKCAALAREWGLLYVAGGGSTGGTALFVHLRVDVDEPRGGALSRQFGWPDRGVASAVVAQGGRAAGRGQPAPAARRRAATRARRPGPRGARAGTARPTGWRRATSTSGPPGPAGRRCTSAGCATSTPSAARRTRPTGRQAHRRHPRHRGRRGGRASGHRRRGGRAGQRPPAAARRRPGARRR